VKIDVALTHFYDVRHLAVERGTNMMISIDCMQQYKTPRKRETPRKKRRKKLEVHRQTNEQS
jgi:hypothetical protein